MLKKWEDIPEFMRLPEVKHYYDILNSKRISLFFKRVFDIVVSLILLIILAIPMIVVSICIKGDSEGTVFYRQERVTTYGKVFRIHKFRTMISDADKCGTLVTLNNDGRITKVGKILRKTRIDEWPQLIDVLNGDMTFVGTRPEVPKYVEKYENAFLATLLLPAGITSEASIRYKDEEALLGKAENLDETYIKVILPEKMYWNLHRIERFSFFKDIMTMIRTVLAVMGKNYE